jgi:hypothetical protein
MFSSLLSPTASHTPNVHFGSSKKSETHRDKVVTCATRLLADVFEDSLPRRTPFKPADSKTFINRQKSNSMSLMDARTRHSVVIHPHGSPDARQTASAFLADTFDKLLFPKPLLLRDLHAWASLVGLRMCDIRMLTALFCANSVRQLPAGFVARGRADKSFGNCADMLGVLLMPHSTCLQVMGLPQNILTSRLVEFFAATHTRVSASIIHCKPESRARHGTLALARPLFELLPAPIWRACLLILKHYQSILRRSRCSMPL